MEKLPLLRFRTLRSKLITSFLLVVVIPVFVVSFVSFRLFQKNMEEAVNHSVLQSLNQANNTINNIINTVLSASNYIIMDKEIADVLQNGNINNGMGLNTFYYNDFIKIQDKMTNLQSTLLISKNARLTIIDNFGRIYRNWEGRPRDYVSDFREQSWFKETVNINGYALWIAPHIDYTDEESMNNKYFITLSRLIKGNKAVGGIGVLLLSIEEAELYNEVFSNQEQLKGSVYYLINSEGVIISHSNKSLIGTNVSGENHIKNLLHQDRGYFTSEIDNKKSMVTYFTVERTGWKIVQIIEYSQLFNNVNNLRNMTIAITLFSLIIFIFVAVFVVITITKPIKKMRKLMKKVEDGNFDVNIEVKGHDEIGEFGISFNSMITKIKLLIEQVREEQKKKEQLRLDALQAQINPHFLFNTLNTIKWTAALNQDESVVKMLAALGGVLELSMGRGNEIISLKNEIEALKNYILIQKMRYNQKFHISYDIDEGVCECRVLKLMLQPIVENCLIHGFSQDHLHLSINVTASIVGQYLIIKVIDNGVGIPEDKISSILMDYKSEENIKGRFSGIGLKNVNDRIKLHFGDNYGLNIISTIENGTIVQVFMPILKGEV